MIIHLFRETGSPDFAFNSWDWMDEDGKSGSDLTLRPFRDDSVDGRVHRGFHPDPDRSRTIRDWLGEAATSNGWRVYWYEKR